jgi:hypothetical protein
MEPLEPMLKIEPAEPEESRDMRASCHRAP